MRTSTNEQQAQKGLYKQKHKTTHQRESTDQEQQGNINHHQEGKRRGTRKQMNHWRCIFSPFNQDPMPTDKKIPQQHYPNSRKKDYTYTNFAQNTITQAR